MISFELIKEESKSEIRPRKWQTHFIRLIRRRLLCTSAKSRDILVHAGPGAGKTLGALLSFRAMKRESLLDRYIVFCHRNSIVSQWRSSSEFLGLKVQLLDFDEENIFPEDVDGLIVTYQAVSRQGNDSLQKLKDWSSKATISIADEAHHLGVSPEEPEGPAWGRSFLNITRNNKMRLGLTGTPFRADNLAFCSARKVSITGEGENFEQITPDLCVEPRDLISEGDVRPLEFHFQDGWVEHGRKGKSDSDLSPISTESRESWRARNLRRAISFSDEGSIAMNLLIRARKKLEDIRIHHQNAAGLVIAKDIEHAESISNILRENGDSVELVHSNESKASDRLDDFEEGNSLWLISVDMCSEGFDAPRIRVVAYLTTVVTKSRFIQAITRSVRVNALRQDMESIPRDPSYVFAPADPLLMEYASCWSIAKPYLIRRNNLEEPISESLWTGGNISLPMEAINHKSGEIIRMRTLELPEFLKR